MVNIYKYLYYNDQIRRNFVNSKSMHTLKRNLNTTNISVRGEGSPGAPFDQTT